MEGGRSVSPWFPTVRPEVAREVTGVSHGNFKRLKELVDPRPAPGAASHAGNREIALYLIEKRAAPTVFSTAMPGQLEVVEATVATQPGIPRQKGPHEITRLAHTKAGGGQATEAAEFLPAAGVGTNLHGHSRRVVDYSSSTFAWVAGNGIVKGCAVTRPEHPPDMCRCWPAVP